MFAGGLIVHLGLILVSVLIGFLTGHWSLPLSQILLNLSLFVLNANPSGMVDGAKIKNYVLIQSIAAWFIKRLDTPLKSWLIQLSRI